MLSQIANVLYKENRVQGLVYAKILPRVKMVTSSRMVLPCESHGLRLVARFLTLMHRKRVVCFVDGFNLYHAISALNRPELNWIDLKALSKIFLKSHSEDKYES